MAGLAAWLLVRSVLAPSYPDFDVKCFEKMDFGFDLKPPELKESTVDPNNPPDEVREAAADMGVSVQRYKERYLDRPSVCEGLTSFYNVCLKIKGDVSECSSILESKEEDYQCSKFEEKYSGQWLKY